uniref:UTP--glucose-1-phosphate uridylyltransferase n=1 Tax=Chlamydomonas euryale TaxID=1486919 RepID=A0A7R9V765_9CHLO|mmetsp:Transcript_23312/g.69243  ORF Transcript_23312/g.69243 Transcript_23312/m.69243 type:complete len:472 (+) Transcript_23312:192-1607(+)
MAQGNFAAFEEKMRAKGLGDAAVCAFKRNYDQLVAGATGLVPEADIEPVTELPDLRKMDEASEAQVKDVLAKTAVLKLNGGLGTSMGLETAKSLLEVKDGRTFIDLIAEQVKHMRARFDRKVLFILMNSFSTSDDTRAFLQEKHPDLLTEPYIELMQNSSPKVDATTLAPATYEPNPEQEWCPPGHGDIYSALLGSGMMDRLLGDGVEYLFVSNSDNLGATLDTTLLQYFASTAAPFMMEVCERTGADKKGGHLCRRTADGKLMLRESAMCPDDDKAAFEDISKHKFFNTNNLWVNLPALKAALSNSGGSLALPLIRNKKTVNPRDSASAPVYQLETAMGSAIECFDGAGAIVVPRTRFAPVKTCGDLFLLRSDVYKIMEDATIQAVVPKVPLVKLDDKHYKLVDKMEALVEAPPSMIECNSLVVIGAVKFAKGVVLKGDCELEGGDAASPAELKASEYSGKVNVASLVAA